MIKLSSLIEWAIKRQNRIDEQAKRVSLNENEYATMTVMVIDNVGRVTDVAQGNHGSIVFKYPELHKKALELYKSDDVIRKTSKNGADDLNAILYNAGFIRAGVYQGTFWVAFNENVSKMALKKVDTIVWDKSLQNKEMFVDGCGENGTSLTQPTKYVPLMDYCSLEKFNETYVTKR